LPQADEIACRIPIVGGPVFYIDLSAASSPRKP
jgi:hypothetical protein